MQFICVVVDLPIVAHMPSLIVQTARRTIEIPQLLVYKVVNVPVMWDVQVPQLQLVEIGVLVVQAVQVVQACRDAVFVSHGPDFASDHRDSSGHPRSSCGG